jgi:hypothetical protein
MEKHFKESGLLKTELSEKSGVPYDRTIKALKNPSHVGADAIMSIAKVLKIDIDILKVEYYRLWVGGKTANLDKKWENALKR